MSVQKRRPSSRKPCACDEGIACWTRRAARAASQFTSRTNVTGIDLRRSFTERAAARFRSEKQNGRFFPLDLREMNFQSEFHGIYSWLGSFGYFAEADNLEVMKRYARALRPGGRLLIDQLNRQSLLRHFVTSQQVGNRTAHNRWSSKTQRVESDWIVNRNGKTEHNRMSIRLYTFSQMKKLYEKTGLVVVGAYGSPSGEPYQRSSKRLILVGRK